MKTPTCIALTVCGLATFAFSQTNPPTSTAAASHPAGATTTNEFAGADVEILSDDTVVEVAASGNFTASRHVKSKILTPRGRKTAEVVVPFNSKLQEIEFHFAKSIQPDGSERAVKPEDLESASVFPGNPAYSDVQVTRYYIPGVEVGSTIDQEYVLKAKPVMADNFWMIWRMRSSMPVLHTTLVVKMSAGRKFQWRVHNLDLPPQVTDSADKQWKLYTWTYAAPTAIHAEPYMPSPDEIMPWLEISTVDSWNDIGKWLDQMAEPQIDTSPELQERVHSLTAEVRSPEDKLAAIYDWIEDNVRFVSVDLGLSGYKPRAASQTFVSRYGDAKDESVLLAAMLRDAGVRARLAFLESGSARKISDRLPMPRQLTHCIVVAEADGKSYYLDPTAETARYDIVLGRLCNTELLLLGKDADKLVPSPPYDGSKHGTHEKVKIQLAADGSVKGEVRTEYLGESDAYIRAAMKYARPEQLQTLMQQEVEKNLPGGRLLDYQVGDVTLRTTNFVTMYRFEAPQWVKVENGMMKIKPQLAQRVDISNEMFSKPDRHFPILFFETAPSAVQMEISMPDNVAVASLPKDVDLENAFSYWKRTIKQDGKRILITEVSHLKTVELPKERVGEIRAYYEQAIARKNDEIVLKTTK